VPRAVLRFVPSAIIATALTIMVYTTAQQVLRLGTNDLLVAMAEDTASALDAGADPDTLLPPHVVDIGRSLSPFLMLVDEHGQSVASSAIFHAQVPVVPAGVFTTARNKGRHQVTWQPETGVRSAIVIVPRRGGFVVSGRSLRLVEQRVGDLGYLLLLFWALTMGGCASVALVGSLWYPPSDVS